MLVRLTNHIPRPILLLLLLLQLTSSLKLDLGFLNGLDFSKVNINLFMKFPFEKQNYDYTCTLPSLGDKLYEKGSDWMGKLRPGTLVSQLSIPGTHDSGTYACNYSQQKKSSFAMTQNLSIKHQLEAGIRYLDLRLKQSGSNLILHHGPVELLHFSEVVDQISTFLEEHPTEFLILAFQGDVDKIPEQEIKKLKLYFSTKVPTVQEMTSNPDHRCWAISQGAYQDERKRWRPKLIGSSGKQTFSFNGQLMEAKETEHYYGQDLWAIGQYFRKYKVSSTYNPKQNGSKLTQITYKTKWDEVKKAAFEFPPQSRSTPIKMKFNYLSMSSSTSVINKLLSENPQDMFNIPKLVKKFLSYQQLPYQIALHHEGPNFKMLQQLNKPEHREMNIGVTIMDFPGGKLIEKIIETNRKHFKG